MPRDRARWMIAAAAAALPLASSGAAPLPHPQEATAVSTLVEAAAAYVRRYQTELTSVIADERYVQEVRAQAPHDGRPSRRTLESEVFFMFASGHAWMTIRDVQRVDGTPLEARPDLRQALIDLPPERVAARFKEYNSRFNIGRVRRNFNEPTISLLVLDDRHRQRFAFSRARARLDDDPSLVRLAFREEDGPTLIRGLQGEDVFAEGDLLVDPSTGRIDEIGLRITIEHVEMRLATRYAANPDLGIAVPLRFTEHYQDGPAGNRYEVIACEATYTNFRRFTVKTRIR